MPFVALGVLTLPVFLLGIVPLSIGLLLLVAGSGAALVALVTGRSGDSRLSSVTALVLAGLTVVGGAGLGQVLDDAGDGPVEADPASVATSAIEDVVLGRSADLCGLLAPRARGPRCASRHPLCAAAACGRPGVDAGAPAEVRGDHAIQRYTRRITARGRVLPGYLRLEQHRHRWLLLDVPGRADACVDRAVAHRTDAFACPVDPR